MTTSMRGLSRVLLLATLVTCAGQPSAAQEAERTRAEELEAARRAKAEALDEAPPPNKVEKTLSFVERSRLFPRIFDPPRGWFGQIGGVGEGNGFTVGGGYRQPTAAGILTARALGSLRQSHLLSVDLTRAFLPRDAGFIRASATRRHEAVQRFYGHRPGERVRRSDKLRPVGHAAGSRPASGSRSG